MACEGCCVFPHGRLSIYTMLMGISAYLFAISASWGCYYIQIDGYILNSFPYSTDGLKGTSGIGPLSFEELNDSNNYICQAYSQDMISDFMDGPWIAARIFAISANILIGICMLLLIVASCVEYTPAALKVMGSMLGLGAICAVLTNVMFASKITDAPWNGSYYIGAGLGLGGALVAAICGILTCSLPAGQARFDSEGPMGQPVPFSPGTETLTETNMPDGTKKITKTTVNMDGSRTVEETIVEA